MPAKAPGQSQLKAILGSAGFADGGRADHLYAPWSGVLGGGPEERIIRNELITFMHDQSKRGEVVKDLMVRIRRMMG